MLNPIRVAILCCGASILTACGGDSTGSSQQILERASADLEAGELREAEIHLKSLLQGAPESADARLLLGRIYLEQGQGFAAETAFERARASRPEDSSVVPLLARALLLQNKFAQVAEIDDFSEELSPADHADLLASRGLALISLGEMGRAGKSIATARKLAPSATYPEYANAVYLARQGNTEASLEALQQLCEADPEFGPAWALRADLSVATEQFEQGEQFYSKAIETKTFNLSEHLKRARLRVMMQQYEEAEADLALLEEKLKRHPEISYIRGLSYYQRKEYVNAKEAFERTLQLSPDHEPATFYLGTIDYLQGNYPLAQHRLQRYVAAHPDFVPANKMLAAIYLSQGDSANAAKYARSAVDAEDRDIQTMTLLANTLMAQEQVAEGRAVYEQMVALAPDSAAARSDLGLALIREGRPEEGISQLEQALQLQPDYAPAKEQLIVSYLQNKEFDKALEAARAYQQEHPERASGPLLRAIVLMEMGEESEAVDAFNEVLAIEPGNSSANGGLAAIALRNGDLEQAARHYRATLQSQPGHLQSLINMASVQEAMGERESMAQSLNAAIEANPEALQPRLLLGRHHIYDGRPDRAVTVLSPAMAKHAQDTRLLSLLSEAQYRSGSYEDARVNLEALIELQPDNALAHFTLGGVYERQGKYADMQREMKATLRLQPTHRQARLALTRIAIATGDLESAEEHIGTLKEQYGKQADIISLEGMLADRRGDHEQALRFYRASYALAANNITLLRIIDALWDLDRQEDAIALMADWLEEYPDDSAVWFEMGVRYLSIDRLTESRGAFGHVVRLDPDNAIALNNIAWALREEDPQEAVSYAERALAQAPGSAEFMDTYALALKNAGQLEKARRVIGQAVELAPDNLGFRFHKALIDKEMGATAAALQELDEILEGDAAFPERDSATELKKALERDRS